MFSPFSLVCFKYESGYIYTKQLGCFLLSIGKKTDTLCKQTTTMSQKILRFELRKPIESFSFDSPLDSENLSERSRRHCLSFISFEKKETGIILLKA